MGSLMIQRFAPARSVRPTSTARPIAPFIALLLAIVIVIAAPVARSQQAGSVDSSFTVLASPQIFATMCALEAAGFNVDQTSVEQTPALRALRTDLLKMQGPAAIALRDFYREHALSDPAETLSHYMTFALAVGPPPDFQFQADRDSLPPGVLTIEGFRLILANFYREANLEVPWSLLETQYGPDIAKYQVLLNRIVLVSNGYLREITKPASRRTFVVDVEPMVGVRTNFRIDGDRYSIVVGAASQTAVDAIQHAYLHFVLDPMMLRNRAALEKKRAPYEIAIRAPGLPLDYQGDFFSMADESFIRAVELRLRHLPLDQLEKTLQDADQSGFVLVRTFVTQLQKFEKAEPAMSYYLQDVIAGIDVQVEQKRVQSLTFAIPGPDITLGIQTASENDPAAELDRGLAEGDREIAAKDGAAATATYEKILAKYPDNLRALYGLAIASVLSAKAERASELFEKILSAVNSPAAEGKPVALDPSIIAWSHVYLGRIHDIEDERDQALNEYQAALATEGSPDAARAAAQEGVQSAYKPARSNDNGSHKP